jgi:hypothetical protein
MPHILRSRLAILALLDAFLIPIVMSSFRVLTHVLTCSQEASQPFTVIVNPVGEPEVLSSMRISKGSTGRLCGGLTLEPQARTAGQGKLVLILPIENHTENLWRGSVTLRLGRTEIPVDIGQVPAGETVTDEVELDLEPGTLEVNGSLLIGP